MEKSKGIKFRFGKNKSIVSRRDAEKYEIYLLAEIREHIILPTLHAPPGQK